MFACNLHQNAFDKPVVRLPYIRAEAQRGPVVPTERQNYPSVYIRWHVNSNCVPFVSIHDSLLVFQSMSIQIIYSLEKKNHKI
jgi:hypothetical protein